MAFVDYREESRKPVGVNDKYFFSLNAEQAMIGAVLRIADAMEKSVEDRIRVEKDLVFYKNLATERSQKVEELSRKISANEGVKTRLRNSIKEKDEMILRLRKNIVELQNQQIQNQQR